MAKYLFKTSYTTDGVKGVLKEGGTGRREAARQLIESLGGRLETFYFAFGDDDVYAIVDFPDNVSAAGVSLAVAAVGAVRVKTVVLLTPEEVDEATQKQYEYRPPGA